MAKTTGKEIKAKLVECGFEIDSVRRQPMAGGDWWWVKVRVSKYATDQLGAVALDAVHTAVKGLVPAGCVVRVRPVGMTRQGFERCKAMLEVD